MHTPAKHLHRCHDNAAAERERDSVYSAIKEVEKRREKSKPFRAEVERLADVCFKGTFNVT